MRDQEQRRYYDPAKVRQPIPAKDILNTDDNVFYIGKYKFKKDLWIRFDILMNQKLAILYDNADVHFSIMQIDSTVRFALLVIKIS
jgi:hypothetical protein